MHIILDMFILKYRQNISQNMSCKLLKTKLELGIGV